MVGQVSPSEKFTFEDPETGARIVQYTQQGKVNRTLYFTNRPYTGDGEHIVFLSDRTGRNEMFLLHLKSGKIVQLTDFAGQPNVSNCIHPSRPELYVRAGQHLHRVNWDTMKSEVLLTAPDGWDLGILNLNSPPWLCFELIEKSGIAIKRGDGNDPMAAKTSFVGNERLYLRDRTLIYRMNVDSGLLECVWGEHKLLTHVQLSPTNPHFLIFSSWGGYGDDRCYGLDVSRCAKVRPVPMFPETDTARGSHECFTRRGNLYIQWMEGDVEPKGNHHLYHGFRPVGEVNVNNVSRVSFEKYRLPEEQESLIHHFTMSEDETWGVHDRWLTAPTQEENMGWLSVFRHQHDEPQTVVEPLCFHNGAQSDRLNLGANLTLDDSDTWGTYTSFLGGASNVCQVHVTPFVEKLMG